jgi:hypothetical protein
MYQPSNYPASGFLHALHTFIGRRPVRRAGFRVAERAERFQPRLEALEDRTLLSVQMMGHYNGIQFYGSGGWAPPDTVGAAGPTSYIETSNAAVAIYTPKETGTSVVSDNLYHFLWVTGGLAHASVNSILGDATMVWDDQVQRFIVADMEVDAAGPSAFPMAVSKSASPATLTKADWNFYTFDASETGFTIDYPCNLGYNHDALVWSFNMFDLKGNFDHIEINAVSIAGLVGGLPNPTYVKTQMPQGFGDNMRATAMHDSVASDPMWFVQNGFSSNTIRVIKEMDPLTAPSFTVTTLTVASKYAVVPPLQPDGTAVTTNIGSQIFKVAEYKGNIVATHNVSADAAGTEDDARWYRIDVSSGTPTLADEGNVSAGPGTYITYPAVDINAKGQIGMTYMESGLGGPYLSTYVTGRLPSDPPGTMEAPVLVQAGSRNERDFTPTGRAGDFSGISVDSDGTFWIANEYANAQLVANWGTTIGHFTLSGPAVASAASPSALQDIGQQFGLGSFTEDRRTVTLQNAPILPNHADGGMEDSTGQAGLGQGGAVSVATATVMSDYHTFMAANHALTSNDDVFGTIAFVL